ncbi:hypothetical protein CDEST_03754 [Colletotrichum destructivum]|uniref:Uncharacterized protein n=1 Tax=Colletotrichum destructivum TaxID=34406 RepID=A0AAX4I645_9PEZI|nr:hypothetical protein CDEST_03754 [Colletotrichum destructivum]
MAPKTPATAEPGDDVKLLKLLRVAKTGSAAPLQNQYQAVVSLSTQHEIEALVYRSYQGHRQLSPSACRSLVTGHHAAVHDQRIFVWMDEWVDGRMTTMSIEEIELKWWSLFILFCFTSSNPATFPSSVNSVGISPGWQFLGDPPGVKLLPVTDLVGDSSWFLNRATRVLRR